MHEGNRKTNLSEGPMRKGGEKASTGELRGNKALGRKLVHWMDGSNKKRIILYLIF